MELISVMVRGKIETSENGQIQEKKEHPTTYASHRTNSFCQRFQPLPMALVNGNKHATRAAAI